MSLSALEVPQALLWKRELAPEYHAPSRALSGWLEERITDTTSILPPDDSYSGNASDPIRLTHAVLAICLNLSTPQNQRVKTEEAFFDPATRHHERAMRKIIANLVSQLDAVQRLAILALPDPRQETVLEAIHKARRESRDDYLLFLYNNHGTLPPTEQGELWVYDQDFPTQPSTYNPVFMSHILDAAKPGAIFVLDSDNSGRLIDSALEYGKTKDAEQAARYKQLDKAMGGSTARTYTESNIYFGASGHQQVLPIAEGLPRDAFTACMLSPLLMALRFSWLNDSMRISENLKDASPNVTKESLLTIPGEVDDRDSPLGELNWLLSAIIETIAWQSMPVDLFRKLFRSDPALNGLSKGFFLAQRVLRTYDCIPVSYPPIPSAHLNPLWQVWDLALDDFLSQLPIQRAAYGTSYVYRSPIMLPECLQAFGAQVRMGGARITADSSEEMRRVVSEKCKLDLPFAIHALLGNRLREAALSHVTRYLDIGGRWPVYWAFQCGLDLLQPRLLDWQSEDDKNKVIYIFSRLIMHPGGSAMLSEEYGSNGQIVISIFAALLHESTDEVSPSVDGESGDVASERVGSILFMMWKALDRGIVDRDLVRREGWARIAADLMRHRDALVRQWALVVWTNVWFVDTDACPRAHLDDVIDLLRDESVEVRASATYTVHLFAGRRITLTEGSAVSGPHSLPGAPIHPEFIARAARRLRHEATHLVRDMMVWVIEELYHEFDGWFEVVVWKYLAERVPAATEDDAALDRATMMAAIDTWKSSNPLLKEQRCIALDCIVETFCALLVLATDPHPMVEAHACKVLDRITQQAMDSVLGAKLPNLARAMASDKLGQEARLVDGEVDLASQFTSLSLTTLSATNGAQAEISNSIATLTTAGPISAPHQSPSMRNPESSTARGLCGTEEKIPNNLDWPVRLARYFDTTRLVWSDTPTNGQASKLETRLRYAEDQGIMCEAQADKAWSHQIAEFSLPQNPCLLRYHAYESTLAVIMDNTLELWNTDTPSRQQSITLARGQRFRQVNFFNEEAESDSMITVSDHGIVRAYRRSLTPEVAASAVFRVSEDNHSLPITRLYSAWNQGRGQLFLAGNTGDISIWSSEREQCVRRMATGSDYRVTAIDTEADRGNISIVGFHDGRVALYDQRQQRKVCVRSYDVHRGRILAVGLNVGAAAQEIVSTSVDGTMNLWDLRVAHQPIAGTSPQRGLPTPQAAGSAIHEASGVCALLTHSAVTGALDLCINRLAFPQPLRTTTVVIPWQLPPVIKEEFQRLAFADFHPTRMQLAITTGPSVTIRGVAP